MLTPVLLAALTLLPGPLVQARTATRVCLPRSICAQVELGPSTMEGSGLRAHAANIYEPGQCGNPSCGIGNPWLVFEQVLVGNGSRFTVWGRWVNQTDAPLVIGQGTYLAETSY
ncbi:MAG: hypothetical protein KGL39_09055 [Patescibacteria group bacterium]|nr:hypothetical protein [Patescibacteria group bacterium]